ncbi:MAG TPA: hypothetical protein VII38_16390 [Polyangia bacterium]
MRTALVPLSLIAALAGCGPAFAVLPASGAPQIVARAPFGVTLTAFADQWQGNPYDLADFVTPIAVELDNDSQYPVRVSFADFSLRDDSGVRYPAIDPFVPASLGRAESAIGEKPVLLAARGGGVSIGAPHGTRGGGGVHFSAPRYLGTGSVIVGAPLGHRHGEAGAIGLGRHHGFRFAGGMRGFYGPGVDYWGGPLFFAGSSWVIGWGPEAYSGAWPWIHPSYDILASGLPEGVLPPGARIGGFLYFRKATGPNVRTLDLAWEMIDAQTNRSLGSTHVPLSVIAR